MLAELCAYAHHLWIDAGVDHGSSNIDRSLGYIVTMLQVLASITALYSVTLKSCRQLRPFLSEQCHNF